MVKRQDVIRQYLEKNLEEAFLELVKEGKSSPNYAVLKQEWAARARLYSAYRNKDYVPVLAALLEDRFFNEENFVGVRAAIEVFKSAVCLPFNDNRSPEIPEPSNDNTHQSVLHKNWLDEEFDRLSTLKGTLHLAITSLKNRIRYQKRKKKK